MTLPPTVSPAALVFGPFRLIPSQRALLRDGRPVRLPSRAWEILKILTQRAGELISKRELMQRAWSGLLVEESTLRVHIAKLRRILEDGKDGVRYVECVTGVGYRFVARVSQVLEDDPLPVARWTAAGGPQSSPIVASRLVGRDAVIDSMRKWLRHRRLVTIVGPGGVGKSVVAAAAAQSLRSGFFSSCVTVDVAHVADPGLLGGCIAAAVGATPTSPGSEAAIAAGLEGRRTLVLLDNCEHRIQPVAGLVDELRASAPGVHFLATSREPLRVRDEWVFRLQPLDVPPPAADLSAAAAVQFSAVSLFVRRAMECRDTFELRDCDVSVVAEICRRMDGIPLAIELAAACMDVLTLRSLTAHMDDVLKLLTRGHRTAASRHRSLRAMLDWSYETLSPTERLAWHRLAVFAGSFDLESARDVLVGEGIEAADVLDIMTELAAKSLLTTRVCGTQVIFTLLHTSRAYALEKLRRSAEGTAVRLRYEQLCGHAQPAFAALAT